MQQKKSRPTSKQSINLKDFDFSVDRSKMFSNDRYDGSATIRVKGKNRNASNHELVLTSFIRKHKLNFKTVAIGKHKKKPENIMAFDFPSLKNNSVAIRKYGSTEGFINSKGHVKKLMEIFGVVIPEKPNSVIKIFFSLRPIVQKGKKNFNVCTISLLDKILDENDIGFKSRRKSAKSTNRLSKIKGGNKKPAAIENIL